MTSLKILSTAAILALVLPLAVATDSYAQDFRGAGGAPSARGGGGAAPVARGGGGPRMGGGGGGPRMGGGGGWHGHRGGGGGGFIPGAIAGAVIGGALAAPYYSGNPYYARQPYYYGAYEEEPLVEVVPGGGDDVAYCIQRFRSYDVRSGTYLGNDGYRHPCP